MTLVVVDDLDGLSARGRPGEADPVPVVDADAVLAHSVTFELLQSVSGWHSQILELIGGVHDQQLPKRNLRQAPWNRAAPLPSEELLALSVTEAPDHCRIVTRLDIIGDTEPGKACGLACRIGRAVSFLSCRCLRKRFFPCAAATRSAPRHEP